MRSTLVDNRFTGLKHHAKVHSFRVLTVVLAWLMIVAAFYEKPELLTSLQRAIQSGVQFVGDNVPAPWGPRIEFVFREIGGFIWLQITVIVVMLRIVLSSIAGAWRLIRRRDDR
jgi:predicted ferric reductase